jgi:hypothetical protein
MRKPPEALETEALIQVAATGEPHRHAKLTARRAQKFFGAEVATKSMISLDMLDVVKLSNCVR